MEAPSIAAIEGEHPDSSYSAAELRIAPEQANAILEGPGLETRFVREGVPP